MKEFLDVFAWTYEYLKEYDTDIIQHAIPIKENENHFRKKLRRMNHFLFTLIEKEISKLFDTKTRKLFDAKIIVSLRFPKWLVLGLHFALYFAQFMLPYASFSYIKTYFLLSFLINKKKSCTYR